MIRFENGNMKSRLAQLTSIHLVRLRRYESCVCFASDVYFFWHRMPPLTICLTQCLFVCHSSICPSDWMPLTVSTNHRPTDILVTSLFPYPITDFSFLKTASALCLSTLFIPTSCILSPFCPPSNNSLFFLFLSSFSIQFHWYSDYQQQKRTTKTKYYIKT